MTQPPVDDEAPGPAGERPAPVDPTESPSTTAPDSAPAAETVAAPDDAPAAETVVVADGARAADDATAPDDVPAAGSRATPDADPVSTPASTPAPDPDIGDGQDGFPAGPVPAPPPPYGQPGFGQSGPGDPYPDAAGAATAPGYAPIGLAPAPRKRRGLLFASIALATTLLFCVGGGVSAYLLLRNADRGEGAAEPAAAVDDFLKAVYTDRDADRAASLTCPEARDDDKIAAKVEEVTEQTSTHDTPRFRWTEPKIDEQDTERALVSTTLTMTTGDERTVDQLLGFIVVEENGWWVCDVV
ncbi:hypothetical protein ACFP2T_04805 [Plantactinospora solaniradicis]|uniref:Ig-like domain-containing protein n=1 Tax=Plantactinospora solaniradicis TaxID=1723736 RepID=A0ABW1K188_9ACTN